eukprot:GGOE01025730.1.p1 GENE.GGOE01025730.1~~GGOE01025730.1.p1  ORF type:complete len:490 (+),score=150.60 GGOE01025730.1:41-1471(+)
MTGTGTPKTTPTEAVQPGAGLAKAKARFAKLDANPNIVVLETRIVDNAACAARDFVVGETVLTEEPLIVIPRDKPKEGDTTMFEDLRQVAINNQLGENYLYSIECFYRVSEETRGRILEFFAPELDPADSEYVRYLAACRDVCAMPRYQQFTPTDLVRYLLVLRTNQHATGEGLDSTGLYELGSKVTHACEPNCLCTMNGTNIEYRAIRPIKRYDMLTFSYISAFDLWKSTLERRKLMKPARFFECCCSRCVGPDYTRRLRCPACQDPRLLYYMPGQPSFIPTSGQPTDTPWTCHNPACGKKFADSDIDMQKEQFIVDAVMNTYFNIRPGTVQDRPAAKQMLRYCDQELGEFHFASALMVYTQLALCHSAIRHSHVDPDPAEVVLPLCERLMYWFCINFPGTMEEANIACFVGGIAELFGASTLAARCLATAVPLLRVLWKPDHPHILDMQRTVMQYGDDFANQKAGLTRVDGQEV